MITEKDDEVQTRIKLREVLTRIKLRKTIGESNVQAIKLEIEADIAMIRGKKTTGKEKLIGDNTLSTKIRNFVARSYRNKSPIYILSTKNGNERIAKAQNKIYQEDRDSPFMKAIRYYKETDKYSTGIAILSKVGWDGKNKAPIWSRINPLLAVPDPYGDYFIGDYRYIGFYGIKTEEEMDELGWDKTISQDVTEGKKQKIKNEQQNAGANQQEDKTVYDVFYMFEKEGDKMILTVTNGNCTHIHEKTILETDPFVFYYWEPNGTFFGNRPANSIRDVQLWKAEMRNLQADKVRQEVYGLWLYNSDYVKEKDVGFGINKKVPVKTGLDGGNIPLGNLITRVNVDSNVSNTQDFIRQLEDDVDLSLALNKIAGGSTPDRRETAKTNSLIMDSTDIILSLNEEMDAIGEQKFCITHFEAYRKHFNEADKKIIYAGSSTGESYIELKKSDFILSGNLKFKIETVTEKEQRQKGEVSWRTQTSPLILQDPTINDSSKRIVMRKLLLSGGAEMEDIEEEVPMTAQYMKQIAENEVLKRGELLPISPDDNDEEHRIAMGDIPPDEHAMIAHQVMHLMSSIKKGTAPKETNPMLAGAMSQSMAQAGAQTAKLNQ